MSKKDKVDPGWRVQFSIVCGIGWLVFLIIWLAFYASEYSIYKNLAIIFASIVITFLLLGGVWAFWSLKMIPREGWEMMKISGFRWRIIVSIIIPIITMIFLIYWFYFQADLYSVYQNIAVLLVTFLIMGGILGVVWSHWNKVHSDMTDQFEKMGEEIGGEIEKKFNK